MNNEKLYLYKKKYSIYRHHAWAGGILLSVLFAINFLIPSIPDIIFFPLVFVLVCYILISLFFTYKYREGLATEEKVVEVQVLKESEKDRVNAEIEKERLKLEKKKAKAEAKAKKKSTKK
jgi:hypothetical protein